MSLPENKPAKSSQLLIPPKEMERTFFKALLKEGFSEERAKTCARIFVDNSLEGVYTHGVNRFARFVTYIRKGFIKVDAEASCTSQNGAIEQWNGNLGPGPLNALQCTERAKELARTHGMGCIGLSNTNHWMRGGTYGWQAAQEGFVFIGWTNTIPNMPAWGAVDNKIGNNPLVMAVPYQDKAIVLDMAMSQFSYGTLEAHKLNEKPLPFPGGYDKDGKPSRDAASVLETRRVMPAGYWKGAGLSLLLDLIGTLLSGGLSTAALSQREAEYGVSQVYMAVDLSRLPNYPSIGQVVNSIIEDYHSSQTYQEKDVVYPGERALGTRKQNTEKGIPVNPEVWHEITML